MADVVLRAEGLDRHFGGVHAVREVSLEVRASEIHAVIGPNGAGKSTLINLLSGDLLPDAGTVRLGESDLSRASPNMRARAGIGRSYQKTTIFPRFSVFENVRLAAQAHAASPLAMVRGANADVAVSRHAADALLRAGLAERAKVMASSLSHGEQRQLEIAMVLATGARVVLLDEPLAGMSPSESRGMIDLILSLRPHCAVLLVEHDMDAVFELADRLTVMTDGRILATGEPQDVRKDPAVRSAYLGEDAAP